MNWNKTCSVTLVGFSLPQGEFVLFLAIWNPMIFINERLNHVGIWSSYLYFKGIILFISLVLNMLLVCLNFDVHALNIRVLFVIYFSNFHHLFITCQLWLIKTFMALLNQPAIYSPFLPKLLEPLFVKICILNEKLGRF